MVISFSRLGNHGRLANQLFQVAGTLGLAEKHKAQPCFPFWGYAQYFQEPFPQGYCEVEMVKEEHFHHYDWKLNGSCDIMGYLQSEKYFPRKRPFTFRDEVKWSVIKKIGEKVFKKETIAIHVRRGDYVNNECYYQLPITYYISALETHFPHWQDCNLIILSDDIEYCKVHFGCLPNAYFEEELTEIEALCLGSLCKNFILSNSSFSWWMAWLGEENKGKIVHPGGNHFAGRLKEDCNLRDFWPERWTAYEQESYTLDILDCTFTIPVFFDHKDRKQNLDLCVCMLQKDFKTNIIVGEHAYSESVFAYMAKYCHYVKFHMSYFHRTKMLNDMAVMSKTPYVANWDADVFVPPMQVYLTVLKLRAGADMVFPYGGPFARWGRIPWFGIIEKCLDLGEAFKGETPVGSRGKSIEGEYSVGGAVFFNKDSFIEGGMENEHMISFGPEDCERHDRFKMLGYRVERANGYLHHINHFIGPDSSKHNQFFAANHVEIEKIRQMNPTTLKQYIKTWPWLKK